LIPRALLFDFGGTLDADGIPWKERFRNLLREKTAVSAERFDRAFYDAADALVGTIPRTTSLADTVRLVARGMAANLHLPDGAAAEQAADRFLAEAFAKLEENSDLLSRLALRFQIGVVSNFYGNLGTVCAETGLAWSLSVTVDSAIVGATKPDRRIFEAALERLGVPPAEALFVGDSLPRDMEGAKALGMPHVWLAAAEIEAPRPCCTGDRFIRRLGELPALLSELS
jgi:putative hydrolase of the HAD superfamily